MRPSRAVHTSARRSLVIGTSLVVGLALALSAALPASAADAPVGLAGAESFAVLGHTTVTNTGPTAVSGDVGVSPGSAVTSLLPIAVTNGVIYANTPEAAAGQAGLTAAMIDAAGRPPVASGLVNLAGSLTAGVYSGGALSITGPDLTLAGDATSVFIFQASSTLITATGTHVLLSGGVLACNVFWVVADETVLGSGSTFVGTVMSGTSISAQTGAVIQGRLLASTGQVSLDSNTITRPAGCTTTGGTGGTGGTTGGTGGTTGATGGRGVTVTGTGTAATGGTTGTSGAANTLAVTGTDPLAITVLAVVLVGIGATVRWGVRRPLGRR